MSDETNNVVTEYDEEERIRQRAEKRTLMKKRKKRQIWSRRIAMVLIPFALVLAIAFIAPKFKEILAQKREKAAVEEETVIPESKTPVVEEIPEETEDQVGETSQEGESENEAGQQAQEEERITYPRELGPYAQAYSEERGIFFEGYHAGSTKEAERPSDEEVYSTYALLLNAESGRVIAAKNSDVRINPASMTKIMTILVAAERVNDLDDEVWVTQDIASYVYKHDCSAVNFSIGEKITVADVMYGTILPSGADAALVLAEYIAGSEEEFVVLMNEKLKELGLDDSAHFTNCTGIYNEDHYCTISDMAMIMKAAVENDLAKRIITEHKYTTLATEEHPEGITISNLFLRRIEDKDTHGEVICAKTGYVNESGCCAASYEISNDGGHYICVTADTWSPWRCIYDHVALYEKYVN